MGNGQYIPSGYEGDSQVSLGPASVPNWKIVAGFAFNVTMIVIAICAAVCVSVSNVLGAWSYLVEQWNK